MDTNLQKKSVSNRIPGGEFYPVPINIRNLELFNFEFFDTIEVVLFCYFIIKYRAFKTGFYYQQHRIENETGIKRAQFETKVKRFVELGIISREKKDFPAKWHYNINPRAVLTSLREIYKLDHPNFSDIEYWFLTEFAEIDKLTADINKATVETSKLTADINNESAEIDSVKDLYKDHNKKNSNKNSKKEETETEMDREALSFLKYFKGKILYQLDDFDERAQFDLRNNFLPWYNKYGEGLRIYVDHYFDSYIEKSHKNTVCGFMQTVDKDIESLINGLRKKFTNRRKVYNEKVKAGEADSEFVRAEDAPLTVNQNSYKALIKLLADFGKNDILNAFHAFCDRLNEGDGDFTPNKNIINYFAADPKGSRTYPVYEDNITYYTMNYGHYESFKEDGPGF